MHLTTLRSGFIGLAFGCLAPFSHPVHAAEFQIQAGRSYMDSYGSNVAFVETLFREHTIGRSRFTWSPDFSLGWIEGRNLARFRNCRYGTDDDVWLAAGGVRFHYEGAAAWTRPFFFSFQGAVHTGHTQALSSTGEFVSTLGWQGRRFNVQIRHISNGALHEPNRGETMVLIGISFPPSGNEAMR